jgi:hypothetical protein
MNTYIITYNMKWKTDGRKVRTRTTFGLTKSVVAPSADVARADFIAERERPWVISKDITKIEQAI